MRARRRRRKSTTTEEQGRSNWMRRTPRASPMRNQRRHGVGMMATSINCPKAGFLAGMGAPPRGEPSPRGGGGSPPRPALWGGGGSPPAPHCGEGGVPRPDLPRKNDQNCGEVAGQNKGLYLNFLKEETNDGTISQH